MADGSYGIEATIDLHECDASLFNKDKLTEFVRKVIELADMKAYGDPVLWEDFDQTEPHLQGISLFQWIHTSDIVIHALVQTGLLMMNLFSCKNFDSQRIGSFAREFFKAQKVDINLVVRGSLEGQNVQNGQNENFFDILD